MQASILDKFLKLENNEKKEAKKMDQDLEIYLNKGLHFSLTNLI